MFKAFAATIFSVLALSAPSLAGPAASPEGTWIDKEGTTLTVTLCGDGTALCGVLNDIQGSARTPENLAYVNQEVVQAEQTAPGQWEGTFTYGGQDAGATVTMVADGAMDITGCQMGILCQTITFYKAS
ncbi:MAG: hypothetical protein KIT02_13180 [Devosia sp.]|uniref:hypothetical protein n=1 Tax=Devosia sp. TaxID=1871048 RepID=UPI0024CBABFC|nr:hypothetical protein [Devosia sp.]UYN98877.1 MAG: hypothetical protein KIT02_13180 [Devosia sp.]